MKISNGKKQLAKIISENGGGRDGSLWAAQDKMHAMIDNKVSFYTGEKPFFDGGTFWRGNGVHEEMVLASELVKNWHQALLSRDEYFHLYPAPDEGHAETEYPDGVKPTDPAKVEGGSKPTIEQLAADYRAKLAIAQQAQEEADSHRCGAEAALERLYQAGLAIGLDIAIADSGHEDEEQPELAITDWLDLRVGDVIELTAGERYNKTECTIVHVPGFGLRAKSASDTDEQWWHLGGPQEYEWRFIRRP